LSKRSYDEDYITAHGDTGTRTITREDHRLLNRGVFMARRWRDSNVTEESYRGVIVVGVRRMAAGETHTNITNAVVINKRRVRCHIIHHANVQQICYDNASQKRRGGCRYAVRCRGVAREYSRRGNSIAGRRHAYATRYMSSLRLL